MGATTSVAHLQPPAGAWRTPAACWAPLPATASGWTSPARRGGKQSLGKQPPPQGCSGGWGHGARQQHGLRPATETRTLQEREVRRVRDPFALDLCGFKPYHALQPLAMCKNPYFSPHLPQGKTIVGGRNLPAVSGAASSTYYVAQLGVHVQNDGFYIRVCHEKQGNLLFWTPTVPLDSSSVQGR